MTATTATAVPVISHGRRAAAGAGAAAFLEAGFVGAAAFLGAAGFLGAVVSSSGRGSPGRR
ncbi:hypothetical protein CCO04_06080 [Pimelobacter sp. 30-1]|nr:hypothetical protein [Pimelobacter sp. 30-1]